MSTLSGFNTWDDVAVYIEETMGITYTDDPTSWVEAMKELTKGYKYVSVVNDVTGETTTQLMKEDLVSGVGEIHVGSNVSSASSVSGGGAKSAPTAKSIITNNSGGGTAVITDEATGVKDTGLINGVTGMGIISGLIQIYGLIHTGVQIANAQVWKDMSNYVYGTNFDNDTPLERVIEFLGNKIVNTVTDITSEGDLIVSIPDSIAEKMYNFLSNHMIAYHTPGVYPGYEGLDVLYNFIQRTLVLSRPDLYTIANYISVTNPTDTLLMRAMEITDDLLKEQASNFVQQIIGRGYNMPANVGSAFVDSFNGTMAYLKEQSVDAVDGATLLRADFKLDRGNSAPAIDVPIALSELYVDIYCCRDDRVPKTVEDNKTYYNVNFYNSVPDLPPLAPGYSYQQGDCVKYLMPGKTGESANDYAYYMTIPDPVGVGYRRSWNVSITFPSNEKTMVYSEEEQNRSSGYTNGFPRFLTNFPQDYLIVTPPRGITRGYNNMGYTGYGESYMPDDYLVNAGFRSKNDADGNPEKHPDPNKTKEEQYPELTNKKQQANPQKVMVSDMPVVQNNITDYVPTSVPFGSENTNRLIEHGMNNPNDPESYQDNRPQEDKLTGKINTSDPVSGYNEATENVIKQYDESRNDPTHYPDPIPANEPNPQYPTNPPSETEGDTGDSPTPADLPGVTASGMVSVYNPTKEQIKNFSAWLWTDNVIENLKKILANPVDAIIGLHIMYATPVTGSLENIICGYLDSGVQAKVVTQQYIDVDCGYVTIPEYYGNVFDYEPYTTVHIYLPFVGIQALKANDVVGKDLYVSYGVDVLTGTCLARLTTKKGSSEICCYQFAGNCAVQIPLTGGNYAEIIKSIASMAVGVAGSVVTANPLPAIGGIISGAMGGSFDVSKSGSLGANAGVMGIRKPYVIITRKIAYEAAGYSQFYGFPANKTVILGNCSGYTRVKSVHIETIPVATDNEKTEIETLLKQGVVIR